MTDVGKWDGTLQSAEERLREAAARVLQSAEAGSAADDAAQADFNAWSSLIIAHPDYVEREKQAALAWEAEHLSSCTQALAMLRRIIPPTICALSKRELAEAVGGPLARRLWQKQVLRFVWMQPEAIGQLHFADLGPP